VESEQERDLSTYKVGRMHIRFDHMMWWSQWQWL
jgi:hypothetical protein